MSKEFRTSLSAFLISLFTLILALTTGCSQSTPELVRANYSVIFEYENDESLPDSRLCLFLESQSDVRKYERIRVVSEETGYIWEINDVAKVVLDEQQWAGNTNIVVPENKLIPTGKYQVTFYTADEKETSLSFNISYDSSIYDLTAVELEEKMHKSDAEKKIAIYDKNDVLLYYDKKTDDFDTDRDVWNYNRNAVYYYDVWTSDDELLICIMPVKKIKIN